MVDKKYKEKEWLYEKYHEENLEQSEMADLCGVAQCTISKYMKRLDVPTIHEYAECPYCSEEFSSLGRHWDFYPEHQPELTNKQRDMITGIVMSDGNVHSPKNQNSRIRLQTTNREYLNYVDEELGILSIGVDLKFTAKEKSEKDRKSGWNPTAKEENYSDFYGLGTRRCSIFNEFAEWYSTGQKRWPLDDIELTPTIFKHLYVGDGSITSNNQILIGCSNENDRKDKIIDFFSEYGFENQSFSSRIFCFHTKIKQETF